ncbi:MAG: hypothetical protein SFT92_00135 [Rickettsiales bacterium]|nr:hypothetical protein [Rickettsiales bacterium]
MLNSTELSKQNQMTMLPLEDFGVLQQRYQSMKISRRAITVLEDAKPALQMVDALLASLSKNPKIFMAIDHIRKDVLLTAKMRASEAKDVLLDDHQDFIETTQHKLGAWRKTMERLASGEGVIHNEREEYIPAHVPLAAAIVKLNTIGSYLSIIQLTLGELTKLDGAHAEIHQANIIKMRRCATFLSDCELASSISLLVH